MVPATPPLTMNVDCNVTELPLQVKKDGIYWIRRNEESGCSAATGPNREGVIVAAEEEEAVCIWRNTKEAHHPWSVDPLWKARAESLLQESGTLIDEERLVNLIKESGGYEEGARHVAAISNIPRLRLKTPELTPDMAYQQLVFPPVTALLYSFDPDRYSADSMVSSGFFAYRGPKGEPERLKGFKPDAALRFSRQHLVLGMLELKRKGFDQKDMQKCVLLTAISALALARRAQLDNVAIPFVVNNCQLANLYTTTVARGDDRPRVQKIFQADMSKQGGAATIVAFLAVMLHRLRKDINECRAAETLMHLDNFEVSFTSKSTSTLRPSSSSNRTQSLDTSSSGQRGKKARGGGTREGAAEVASCGGEILGLRASVASLDGGGRRRTSSPFYFVGAVKAPCPTTAGLLPVFIKVWCADVTAPSGRLEAQGSSAVRRRDRVETEIRLLKRARDGGVPCPEVVDRLTMLNVISSAHAGWPYHRLVMHKLPNHLVRLHELIPYAASLVRAVCKLHETGLLHCDIKPGNVLWDSFSQSAFLIDFGHAQEEVGAASYLGTEGYTAPEVVASSRDYSAPAPHSRLTDAYSVGKTLQRVYDRAVPNGDGVVGRSDPHHRVREVASQLTREDPSARITLESALRLLVGTNLATETMGKSRSLTENQGPSSVKLVSP